MISGDANDGTLFRTADAQMLGVSKRQLAKNAERRLTRGVYAKDLRDTGFEARVRAVMVAVGPRVAASHFTAARLLGGVVPHRSALHVTSPLSKRVQRVGVISHRSRRSIRTTSVRGLCVTTGTQTFLDLAAMLDLVDLVVLGDSLVACGASTLEDLLSGAAGWRGTGVANARRVANLVRGSVASPMETRLRLLMVLAGLPEPTVDHRLYDADGRLTYRLDLAYPHCKLGIEYDGRHHAETDEQWNHDLRRREDFDGSGWRLVIVNGQQFYRDPGAVLDRIVAAARQQGLSLPSPNLLWRRHFSVA
jgi:hypothetical protein